MNYLIFQKHGNFELRSILYTYVHYTMPVKLVFNIAK